MDARIHRNSENNPSLDSQTCIESVHEWGYESPCKAITQSVLETPCTSNERHCDSTSKKFILVLFYLSCWNDDIWIQRWIIYIFVIASVLSIDYQWTRGPWRPRWILPSSLRSRHSSGSCLQVLCHCDVFSLPAVYSPSWSPVFTSR